MPRTQRVQQSPRPVGAQQKSKEGTSVGIQEGLKQRLCNLTPFPQAALLAHLTPGAPAGCLSFPVSTGSASSTQMWQPAGLAGDWGSDSGQGRDICPLGHTAPAGHVSLSEKTQHPTHDRY